MFSNLSEKTKAALFLALGMGLFLLAGSLVHFFPRFNLIENVAIEKNSDQSSSIEDLYQNLSNTDSGTRVPKAEETNKAEVQNVQAVQIEVDDRWILYITGSVKTPGVYKIPADARVFQLGEAAGGFTATADVIAVNMAARLQDGDHLHVPKIGDNNSGNFERNRTSTSANSRTAVITQNKQNEDATKKNQRTSKKNPQSKSIDLNTATAAELQMLPGIGSALSDRIIQHRNKNGRFKHVSDLISVQGIGAKLLDSIEPFVFVR